MSLLAGRVGRVVRPATVQQPARLHGPPVGPCGRSISHPVRRSARQVETWPVARAATVEVSSPAAPVSSLTGSMTDEERAEYAHSIGYRQIGKDLPRGVTLQQVISTLPKEVFELNPVRAWGAVLTSIVSMAASLYLIAISPWYLLPLAWALSGTAFTGWFVVGHDCGHRSFSKNKLLEDIVGTVAFAPLVYPFEPWRIKHNHHHAHTNKLEEDTAWHPITTAELDKWGDGMTGRIFKFFLGTPLKLWASVGHWAIWHFNINKFTEKQRPRVYVSWLACAAFALGVLPALVATTGWLGLVKFWLMPWLGYHFWMSTFTVIHHTAPHIPFRPAESWNAAEAQLAGTVHCDFPKWVEFLTHDISVHVPHHINSKIPWYNLRKAHASLQQNWGQYMTEAEFNWRMVKSICTELHVYDEEVNYKPFDAYPGHSDNPLWALQRKFMPNFYSPRVSA